MVKEQERTIFSDVDEVPELILRRQTLITEGSVQEQYPYLEQTQDNKNKHNNLEEEEEESKENLSLPKSTENFSSQILQDFWKNPVDYIKDNEEEMAEDKTFLTQSAAPAVFSSTHQSSDEEEGEDLNQEEDVVEYEESEDEEEEDEDEEEDEEEGEEEENEDEEEEADIKNRIERILYLNQTWVVWILLPVEVPIVGAASWGKLPYSGAAANVKVLIVGVGLGKIWFI
ncbi:unnamed protein product [Timema podura]|uniref:Uncharacterized protein n=1 Tax=Timema podura TaxID=61482 RepID=A0ABN7NCF6_TIMPD|nr:unnamed protein product [Timema podura]